MGGTPCVVRDYLLSQRHSEAFESGYSFRSQIFGAVVLQGFNFPEIKPNNYSSNLGLTLSLHLVAT